MAFAASLLSTIWVISIRRKGLCSPSKTLLGPKVLAMSQEQSVTYVSGPDMVVMVRKGGLEPPCPCGRSHLKAVRLPISPLPLGLAFDTTSSNPYLKLVRLLAETMSSPSCSLGS